MNLRISLIAPAVAAAFTSLPAAAADTHIFPEFDQVDSRIKSRISRKTTG